MTATRKPSPINRQISTSAQYYSPSVYAFGALGGDLPAILSFYHDLTLHADPMAAGFVPLSAVPAKGRNTKLFAIGILPPVQNINLSQRLDRSGSIARRTGGVEVAPGDEAGVDEAAVNAAEVEELPQNLTEIALRDGTMQEMAPNVFRNHLAAIGSLHGSIKGLAEQVIAEARRQGIVLVMIEGLRSGARQDKLYAQGRTAPGKIVTGVKSGRSWHQHGLAFDVAMVGAKGQPHWPPGPADWNTVGNIGKALGLTWGGHFSRPDQPHFEYHPGFGINEAIAGKRPPIPPPAPVPVKADVDSAVFQGYGSDRANAFRQDLARQVDMIKGQVMDAQQAQMLAIQSALQAMMNTPPLRLLVNPNKFTVKSQKIVTDGNWGRNGPMIEFWGDDQDKISGAGQVAAFYALDAAPGLGQGGPGLTRHARNFSQGWQNFQSLYLLYKNNGGMYVQGLGRHSRDVVLSTVGSVYIFYDNILYIGSFDSLNMTEVDTKPFTLEYNFEFTVRAAFLLEFPSMFNYGGASAFSDGQRGLQTWAQA